MRALRVFGMFGVFGVLGLLRVFGVLAVLLADVGVGLAATGKGARGKRTSTSEDAGETQKASRQLVHNAWTEFVHVQSLLKFRRCVK